MRITEKNRPLQRRKMKKNIFWGIVVFACLFFAFPVLAQGQTENSNSDQVKNTQQKPPKEDVQKDEKIDLSKLKPVAVVNAGNINLEDKGNNSYNVSFDLMNQEGIQPYVKYAIDLVQKKGKEEIIVDRKAFDEILNIGNKEIINKTVSYQAPNYLSGKYTLFLEAENDAGLRLAYISAGEIDLSGESKIEVKNDSCQIFFGEKEFDPKNATQFFQDGFQNPSLRCVVKNVSSGSINVYLKADIYEESYLGSIAETKKSDEISLGSNEEKEFKIDLAQLSEMQGPLVAVSAFSGDNQISNNFYYPFKILGKASLFYNVRLSKDYYEKNETAKITADLHLVYPKGSIISVSITEENEMSCLETKNNEESLNETGTTELSEKIIRNCFNPTLQVYVKDKDGKIIGEKKYFIESKSKESNDARSKIAQSSKTSKRIQIFILVVLGLIVFGKLASSIFSKVKYKNFNLPLLLFFLAVGFLMFSNGASAITYVIPDENGYSTFYVNLNDPVPPRDGGTAFYIPDDSLTFSASVTADNVYYSYGVDIHLYFNSSYYYMSLLDMYDFYDPYGGNLDPYILHNDRYEDISFSKSRTVYPYSRYSITEGGGGEGFGYPIWHVNIEGMYNNSFQVWSSLKSQNAVFKVRGVCGDMNDSKWWRRQCSYGYPGNDSCTSSGLATWVCESDPPFALRSSCSYDNGSVGKCSSANGVPTSYLDPLAPTSNYCTNGGTYYMNIRDEYVSYPPTFSSGSYNWMCSVGSKGLCTDYCSAPVICKSDTINKKYYTFSPSRDDLCFNGNPNSLVWNGISNKWTWNCNYNSANYPCEAEKLGTVDLKINGAYSSTVTAGASPTFTWSAIGFNNNECKGCNTRAGAGAVDAWRNPNPALYGTNWDSNYSSCENSSNYLGTKQPISGSAQYQHNTPTTINYELVCAKKGAGLYASQYFFARSYASLTVSAPVNCGSANGVLTCAPPASNLCSDGSMPVVNYSDPNYVWVCGSNLCRAAKNCPAAPDCGTASSNTYCDNVPSSDLCSNGSASSVSLSDGEYTWTCSNIFGNTSCLAKKHCPADDVWKEVEP
jgi:hypothetical protein